MASAMRSGSGRRPLMPIEETPAIRLSRNAMSSTTTSAAAAKKQSASYSSSPTPSSKCTDDSRVLRSTTKRLRTEDAAFSTPRKTRKLTHQADYSIKSTPESLRYDSGIEMTPESVASPNLGIVEEPPPSPCERKCEAKLDMFDLELDARQEDVAKETKKPHDRQPPTPLQPSRRARRSANPKRQRHRNKCETSRCGSECLLGEEPTRNSLAEDTSTSMLTLPLSRTPSDSQNDINLTASDTQSLWQPAGPRQDVAALLSMLGETVVQQQRKRTSLQYWLRSHDDHLMFWLNYGGSSSPSDYLRWTKRVRSDHESKRG